MAEEKRFWESRAEVNGRDVAKALASMLNSGNSSSAKAGFIRQLQGEHPTIQQLATGLFADWLRTAGSETYQYDGRNEATHELGRKFIEKLGDDSYLPFI